MGLDVDGQYDAVHAVALEPVDLVLEEGLLPPQPDEGFVEGQVGLHALRLAAAEDDGLQLNHGVEVYSSRLTRVNWFSPE